MYAYEREREIERLRTSGACQAAEARVAMIERAEEGSLGYKLKIWELQEGIESGEGEKALLGHRIGEKLRTRRVFLN